MLLVGSAAAVSFEGTEEQLAYTRTNVTLLIIFVLLALFFSFLCSIAEAVLLSITPSYIEELRERKHKRASVLKRLRQDNVDRSLAAILTLNTIAHTIGATIAGAQAAIIFGSKGVGIFSGILTLMILYLSEIIPKTIGAIYWRQLVGVTAGFVRLLISILFPLIRVSEGLTRMIARGKNLHVFSRAEFIAMANIGEQTGEIEEHESRIIRNLFKFGSLKTADIMTPRSVISAIPQNLSINEAAEKAIHSSFSRLPIYGNDLDEITGFVLKDDIVLRNVEGQGEAHLESLKRKIFCVSEEMSLSDLLEFFLDNRQHIALVVDEYGGTQGLVTLEDVVETLLGMEIIDEMDKVVDMRVLARQQWEKRAKSLGIEFETVEQLNDKKEKSSDKDGSGN
ncbi:MAG TPA: HlyC/CorC family transporter [Deltaproteobacteria bacterium]|nr:HlyC/CorC family transporter [Deltaproteobacteria bacterium]